jgi:hypothetical protein
MEVPVKVLVAVATTVTAELWLPPSTKSEAPSGLMARLRTGPVSIGAPTNEPVSAFTSTT